MARKRGSPESDTNGTDTSTATLTEPPSPPPGELPPSDTNGTLPDQIPKPSSNGDGEPRRPIHVLGYLVAKDTFVQASIWDRLVTLGDGSTFMAHDVSVRKRYRDPQSGEWKSLHTFRGSELYAVLHALTQASAWILEARASMQSCPS